MDNTETFLRYNKIKLDTENHEADLLFDYEKKEFHFEYNDFFIMDGVSSVLAWISAILRPANQVFDVYDENFGNRIMNFIEDSYPNEFIAGYAEIEIERLMRQNPEIAIVNWITTDFNYGTLVIDFSIKIYGYEEAIERSLDIIYT